MNKKKNFAQEVGLHFVRVLLLAGVCGLIAACSGSSDSGQLEDGESLGGNYGPADYRLVYALNASAFNGAIVRYMSKTIGVSHAHPTIVSAGRRWQGFGLVHNGARQINFVGYSRQHPRACAWAIPFGYNTGQVVRCDIYLHPDNIDSAACVNAELVIAHEIGHCLGVWAHTADGGLMSPIANGSPNVAQPNQMLNILYTIPLPSLITPSGTVQSRSLPRSFDLIQHPTLFTYPSCLDEDNVTADSTTTPMGALGGYPLNPDFNQNY